MAFVDVSENPELIRTLRVAYDYWESEPTAINDRVICFAWVRNSYRRRFGIEITRAQFERLWRLGFLEKADDSRGGQRRYYRLCEPDGIARLLAQSCSY